ncbi:MAG: alcohol dehydrogenase catalytic domain-containing protein [Propylenella sp.]
MRAAVFHKVGEPLTLEAVADPSPAAGEVVVRVERCGICGSDLHMSQDAAYQRESGFVFGHEYAGKIVALGRGVDGFRIGDRIAVMPITGCGACARCLAGEPAYCDRRELKHGGYAEYALGRAREALALPESLTAADGALLEPLADALHGVRLAGMRAGARVLVIGAGPIGLAAAFWAKRLGAGAVAVTARSTRNAARAEAMGASFVQVSERLQAEVSESLCGAPDIVLECAGQPGTIDLAMQQLAGGGTVVILGICWEPDRIAPRLGIRKECRLQFSAFFTLREFEQARDAMAAGHLQPRAMVTHTVTLDELPAAFEALRAPTDQCKVMVAP